MEVEASPITAQAAIANACSRRRAAIRKAVMETLGHCFGGSVSSSRPGSSTCARIQEDPGPQESCAAHRLRRRSGIVPARAPCSRGGGRAAARTGATCLSASRRRLGRRLRQHGRRVRERERLARRRRQPVLDRTPGMGVPRLRAPLPDPAHRRPLLPGGHPVARPAAHPVGATAREPPWLLFYAALAIPSFYAVGLLAGSRKAFVVTDFWRFWVVHRGARLDGVREPLPDRQPPASRRARERILARAEPRLPPLPLGGSRHQPGSKAGAGGGTETERSDGARRRRLSSPARPSAVGRGAVRGPPSNSSCPGPRFAHLVALSPRVSRRGVAPSTELDVRSASRARGRPG